MRNHHSYGVGTALVSLLAVACGGSTSNPNNNAGGTSAAASTGGSSSNNPSGGMANTGGVEFPQTSTEATGGGGYVIVPTSVGGSSYVTKGGSAATGGVRNTGGFTGTGGARSTGGTSSRPPTTVVGPPAVDVLLMVDNSAYMADKQQILAASVPRLIERLVQPNCLDSSGTVLGKSQLGTCAQGTPEFSPVNNLHIGVITSSLGDHGAGTVCTPGSATSYTDSSGQPILTPSDVNDMGHLMGTLARGTSALSGDTAIAQNTDVKLDAQGFWPGTVPGRRQPWPI